MAGMDINWSPDLECVMGQDWGSMPESRGYLSDVYDHRNLRLENDWYNESGV